MYDKQIDPNEVTEEQQAEAQKTFTQDDVNSLIGRTKQEERERARRAAEEEYQQKLSQMQQQYEQKSQYERDRGSDMSHEEDFSHIEDIVERRFQEREQQAQQERAENEMRERANQVVSGYEKRIAEAREHNPDIEKALKGFNPYNFGHLVVAAHDIPGSPLAIESLMRTNPMEIKHLNELAQMDIDMAKNAIKRISDEMLKRSEVQSAHKTMPREPLEQPTPSIVSNGDSENASFGQLRKLDWLKG